MFQFNGFVKCVLGLRTEGVFTKYEICNSIFLGKVVTGSGIQRVSNNFQNPVLLLLLAFSINMNAIKMF